jgi:hypothetical protein
MSISFLVNLFLMGPDWVDILQGWFEPLIPEKAK